MEYHPLVPKFRQSKTFIGTLYQNVGAKRLLGLLLMISKFAFWSFEREVGTMYRPVFFLLWRSLRTIMVHNGLALRVDRKSVV